MNAPIADEPDFGEFLEHRPEVRAALLDRLRAGEPIMAWLAEEYRRYDEGRTGP